MVVKDTIVTKTQVNNLCGMAMIRGLVAEITCNTDTTRYKENRKPKVEGRSDPRKRPPIRRLVVGRRRMLRLDAGDSEGRGRIQWRNGYICVS